MSKDTTVYIENVAAETKVDYEALTVNVTDGSKFSATGVDYWSEATSLASAVRPNGVKVGGAITPGSANDTVDIAELTCNLNGVAVTVAAAAGESVTRGLITDTHIQNAITVDNAGAIAVIAGVDHTAFATVLGDPGAPPYIPADSVLIGMIKLTSITAAVVVVAEIFTGAGVHREETDFPSYEILPSEGLVKFVSVLPSIHTGDIPKKVYAEYAEFDPSADIALLGYTDNLKLPEETYSASPTNFHNNQRLVDITSDVTEGSFDITFKQDAGINVLVTQMKGQKIWFKCFPDKNRPDYYFLIPPSTVSLERDAISAEASTLKATVTLLSESQAIEVHV